MDCSTPGFPVLHHLQCLLKLMSIALMMPSNYLIFCHPLLLLPSIFPSIRVFSNESVLCIRWPKHWSFSFSISPSSEYSGLISLRLTGLISLQSKGLQPSNNTPARFMYDTQSLHLQVLTYMGKLYWRRCHPKLAKIEFFWPLVGFFFFFLHIQLEKASYKVR